MIELADTPLSPRTIQKEEPIYASYRSYETVMEALKIPRNYFTPGLRVLSVGEGLSDFARRLAEKGVDVLALDPIYMLGKKILQKNPAKVSKAIQKAFGTKVRLLEDDEQKEIPLPDPKRIMAGSVYNLPFPYESFNRVVGHRVTEHIDLAQALPEMIRVLEPDGEVRLSGVLLSASRTRKKLLLGLQEYDSRSGNYHLEPLLGMEEAMKWLTAQKTLSMYVLFDGLARRSEVRRHNPYVAGVMIIRKDTNPPRVESQSKMRDGFDQKFRQLEGYPDQYPGLGKIYKVDPSGPKVIEDKPWEYYYELSEI